MGVVRVNIDEVATQTGLARLVGVSQQAISTAVAAGTLTENASYKTWLIEYCEKLRREASGRGGDEATSLARARTQESLIKTKKLELEYYRDLGLLVALESIEPLLVEWALIARSEIINVTNAFAIGLESKHKIQITQDEIDNAIRSALAAIERYPSGVADAAGSVGGKVEVAG